MGRYLRLKERAILSCSALESWIERNISDGVSLEHKFHDGTASQKIGHSHCSVLRPPPDLLAPLGESRAETSHSQIVSWLMRGDSEEARRCRRNFLRLFEVEDDAAGFQVDTELTLGSGGRVDLALSSSTHLLFVEMKVDAEEHGGQMDEYLQALHTLANSTGRKARLGFLTLPGATAASISESVHRTFLDLLGAWLPLVAEG